MRWLALVLLLGVFVAHDGANWLSAKTGIYPWAVFFMLQGAWTVILSAFLVLFVWGVAPSFWKSLGLAALAVSIIEGIQIPLCGLFVSDFALIPRGVNVCDHVTHLPVTAVTVCVEVFVIAWIVGRDLRE